ncbi:MAG: ABC transporter [Acidobacteria bacterium]|nr:MAG: ABC transporter [Acidobacteriota bacterium]PYY04967.1 MAG: ABC transporter [Acidobacteriota bacterium]
MVRRGHFLFADYNRSMAAVLEFESISKRYRSFRGPEHWALRDFSLQLEPGEIMGFLGPNGAGKTTAIHIALGLVQPTAGKGTLLRQPFGNVLVRQKLGFLSEAPAFYHQDARNALKFYAQLNGVTEPNLSRRVKDLLESVDLAEDANRNIGKFSRGMLQRVGIAQALINDPELLILDEPTSALDPLSRLKMRELLLQHRSRGKSIFLSSHQLSEIELICDRVIFIQKGRVIAGGHTQELLRDCGEFEITASGLRLAPPQAQKSHVQDGHLVFLTTAAQQRRSIEQVWSAGGTVVSVVPKTRTMEELFVELMTNSESTRGKTQ